jgi:hypothetical protein
MYTLALYREEYTIYEDVGAFVDGFLGLAKNSDAIPLARIIRCLPRNVKLDRLLLQQDIATVQQLYEQLGLKDWLPGDWNSHFPTIDLPKVLLRACHYVVEDCAKSQKSEGLRGFNKIKHGLVMIPNARRLIKSHPDGPALLFLSDPESPLMKEGPVTLLTVTMGDDSIEERRKQIFFVQGTLRMLALLYVLKRYPAVPANRGLPKVRRSSNSQNLPRSRS